MKNLERDRRRKKGAIGSQDGGFRTFERRTGHADGRSATCILEGGADVTVYSVWVAVTSKWHFRTTSPMNTNSSAGENGFSAKNGS